MGLVPLGDAIASFNPLYAQGMSQSAQHATVLRRWLDDADGKPPWTPARFDELRDALAAPTQSAWHASTVGDFAYPQTAGDRPPDLEARLRFQRGLRRLIKDDPDVHKLVFSVRHLLMPASELARTEIVDRVKALEDDTP